jgi:1-phosphofructokinase
MFSCHGDGVPAGASGTRPAGGCGHRGALLAPHGGYAVGMRAVDDGDGTGTAVCVLAPAPLLTITIEDKQANPEVHLHAGGQGFWLARMVRALGTPLSLCASFGGETGAVVRMLIEREDIELRAVEVATDNVAYVHDRRSGQRQVVAEMAPSALGRHDVDALYAAALAAGLAARVCVLGGPSGPGVPPPEFYRRLARDLRANGKLVVADLSGDVLTAALDGGLDLLKVSAEELVRDSRAASEARSDLVAAMRSLHASGASMVVVSRADRPALASDGDVLHCVAAPQVEPVDVHGGGDALTAGVVAGLSRGDDLTSALRLGAAAAALNVARRGLATGRREDIEQVAEKVQIFQ